MLSVQAPKVSSKCDNNPFDILEVLAGKQIYEETGTFCFDIDSLMAVEDYDMNFLEGGLDQEVATDYRRGVAIILDDANDKLDVLLGQEAGARRSLQSVRCGLACGACQIACSVSTGSSEAVCLAGTLIVCLFPFSSLCKAAEALCRAPGNACRAACAL